LGQLLLLRELRRVAAIMQEIVAPASIACYVALFALLAVRSAGHGQMTSPPSRNGGNLTTAGYCFGMQMAPCLWFSQPTTIPGEPTLNDAKYRTYNVKVADGPNDWTRKMPWRAPGSAPVLGSGCGVAGGNPLPLPNGGFAPPGVEQGLDGLKLPETKPTVWERGAAVEVAWSTTANHGGGYSWRLCKKGGNVSEACFQQNVLRFAGNTSWLQYSDRIPNREGYLKLPRFELPLVKVSDGTFPAGSEWARNPIPSCAYCDQTKCGHQMPNMTDWFEPDQSGGMKFVGGEAWWKQEKCAQDCSGFSMMACPPGMTQFEEALPGISSYLGSFMIDAQSKPSTLTTFGIEGVPYSVVDKVVVPEDLEAGDYLLSWRWDCEQSPQIWQNCADVQIVDGGVLHI